MNFTKIAIGIIIKKYKIYITRGKYQENIWEFPGGKVKKNENLINGLKRELFEEVGIKILKFKFFRYVIYTYCKKTIKLYFFLINKWIGKPYSREGYSYIWVYINNLKFFGFPPANYSVINSLQNRNFFHFFKNT